MISSLSCKVDILLSTFNGEKYLEQQFDSIIAQEFADWHLLIRDDGSSDETINIINQYVSHYPLKITFSRDAFDNLGPAGSFSTLLEKSTAPYISFCDQDDVWLPDKLQKQMQFMLDTEKKYSTELPLLVHSNLKVVDERLSLISNSFWDYQNINPDNMNRLEKLLVQNYVTGCTVLINRKLLDASTPIPKGVIMHDWWIALITVSNGHIININEPTILYRQHDNNDTGAKNWGFGHVINMIIKGPKNMRKSLFKTRDQAVALLGSGVLDENQKVIVENYINMFELNWFLRRWYMLRHGFTKHGVFRNIGLFLVL